MALHLSFACELYDKTLALWDGRVKPSGIDLTYLRMHAAEIFWDQLNFEEFDVSEMSLSAHIMEVSRHQSRFCALPVYTSRAFRRGSFYVRGDSAITSLADLRGARVGVPEYHQTAGLFMRGIMSDEFGIEPRDVQWFQAGLIHAGRKERVELRLPESVSVTRVGDRTLEELLRAGDVDAIACARMPPSFRRGEDWIRTLYEDPIEEDLQAYRRDRLLPIMHIVVVRRDVYDEHPWVGKSLWNAFTEAKAIAHDDLVDRGASFSMLPFFSQLLQRFEGVFGPELDPYGIEENRAVLERAVRWSYEQGLSERLVEVEELFPANLLEVHRS